MNRSFLLRLLFIMIIGSASWLGGCLGHLTGDSECGIEESAEMRADTLTSTLTLEMGIDQKWRAASILRTRRYADRARAVENGAGTVEILPASGLSPRAWGPTHGIDSGLALAFSPLGQSPSPATAVIQQALLSHFSLAIPLPDQPTQDERLVWTPELEQSGQTFSALSPSYEIDLNGVPLEDLTFASTAEGVTSSHPIEVVHWSGNPRNRVNLVVMPDGYTEEELPLFRQQVAEMVQYLTTSGDNDFYGQYSDLFNVIRLDAPSQESGASCDDGTSRLRNTRYGVTFPVGCTNAILGTTFNDRFPFPRHYARVVKDSLSVTFDGVSIVDEMIVLSNSRKRAGSGIPGLVTMTNATGWGTMAHELGHSWGRLADEYTIHGDLCNLFGGASANISTRKSRAQDVKWSLWIEEGTPIPTPDDYAQASSAIGLYQGAAGGCFKSYYRPSNRCKMSRSGTPFCSVCKEQMIRRTYDRASLIEGPISNDGTQLTAPVLSTRIDRVRARWFADGELIQDTNGFESLPLDVLPTGTRQVKLVVWDEQAPVRKNRCDLAFRASYSIQD